MVLFSLFFFFFSKFFLINSHWFGMYIYFFLSLICSFFFRVNCSLCLLHFLFFFLFKYHAHSLPKPPKLLLAHSIFLPRNNSKSSPRILQTHPMRSPKLSAYLKYLISKPFFFFEHLPPQNLTVPLQGGTHKITVCLVRHKKTSASSLLCLYGKISETIFPVDTDNEKSEAFNRPPN